jgi:DNA-binding transcriptional regulator YiaG
MKDEAKKLKRVLRSAKREFSNTPYPTELRRKATAYIIKKRSTGVSWNAIGEALGISITAVKRWHQQAVEPSGRESTKVFVPVRMKPTGVEDVRNKQEQTGLHLITPGGYRIEGLDAAGVIALLRDLA